MTLEIEIPDSVLNLPAYTRQDLLLDVAVSLYQRGLYTLPNAARFAGLTEPHFQQVLGERKIPLKAPTTNEAARAAAQRAADLATIPPELIRPIRKKVTIEDLIREQNYKGVNIERMNKAIADADIQEPIELLLQQLTA